MSDTCNDCHRPIEYDNLRGKPAGNRLYCVGTDTCIQRRPEVHADGMAEARKREEADRRHRQFVEHQATAEDYGDPPGVYE